MSMQRSLLFKSLVKPFYRQHAGLFCFIFFMMFLAVGRANGVGLLEYHYSLIQGMLRNPSFLVTVLAIWLVYAARCMQFIVITLRKPAFSYLYLLSQVNAGKLYWLLLQVQLLLFLPVLWYLFFVVKVGYQHHWYLSSNLALLFTIFVCAISAWRYWYLVRHPAIISFAARWKWPAFINRKYYTRFLFRFIAENNKLLFLIIKLYSCGVMYMMLAGRNSPAEDQRMVTLFFSLGVLGHGVLIHRVKEMENTRLAFMRTLPVSIARRFAQYAFFYFCIFLPDIIAIASLAPEHLFYSEAFFFIFLGYSILLLLNSLQLYHFNSVKDYLKAVVQLFLAVVIAVIPNRVHELSILFFILAVLIFFRRYYRFEITN